MAELDIFPEEERCLSRADLDIDTLTGLYMKEELQAPILRMEIDNLKEKLTVQEKAAESRMVALEQKHADDMKAYHSKLTEGLNECRGRLGNIETPMAIIYGDPNKSSDDGLLGNYGEKFGRIFKKLGAVEKQVWTIRVALLLGGGSAVAQVLKVLGAL